MSQMHITIPIALIDLQSDYGAFDPWRLCNEFMGWPLADWQGFILMTGEFGTFRVSEKDFEEWQLLFRKALLLPAHEWKSMSIEFDARKVHKLRASLPIRFDWDVEPPTATLIGTTALKSMIASIQLEKLQGAEFRVCARADCKSPPFKVGTRQKIYCSYDCGHLVAVRKSRTRIAKLSRGKGIKRKVSKG